MAVGENVRRIDTMKLQYVALVASCYADPFDLTGASNVHVLMSRVSTPSLGKWEASGVSGVVCIHTALLPDSKLLCMERPHQSPYQPNSNTGGFLSSQIDLRGTVNADGSWTAKYNAINVVNNPFCKISRLT